MSPYLRSSTRARRTAGEVLRGFESYMTDFRGLCLQAKRWFEERDTRAMAAARADRIDLYGRVVEQTLEACWQLLGPALTSRPLWVDARAAYAARIANRDDEELAETFFNSVTRKIFKTVGVDPEIELLSFDAEILPSGDEGPAYESFYRAGSTQELVRSILERYRFEAPYEDADRDAREVAEAIDRHLTTAWIFSDFDSIELLKPVFFRNKGAYLVGRIRRAHRMVPLILPLVHEDRGIRVDAVLLTEADASRVFSFTRSYFFVDARRPAELIGFIKSLIPFKPLAELYIGLGLTKHGKTVMYRHLHRQLESSVDRFEPAPGTRGMVMVVFTHPSHDLVFKVIRDRFGPSKTTTHRDVIDRYRVVFKHDRAGRLVDAQEFEGLEFDRDQFSDELLEELRTEASEAVDITARRVVIRHAYLERKVKPLDLYVAQALPERARTAVIDYGWAIRELAASNIFPGDLLVKNFGVTRHGRVVFYDYDELCLLTDVEFRSLPEARNDEEEFAAEPWFHVGERDVFPEQFRTFLWRPGPLLAAMVEHHGDLFTVEYWCQIQERVRRGEMIDLYPYRDRGLPPSRASRPTR